ncbi:hypothetical protein ES703_43738 [subsurface metagenome]
MTNKKLLKEIGVELSEARAMHKQRHYRTMKACLLHIEQLIAKNVKHFKG